MAGATSVENGKKGGRPKGSKAKSTLEAIVVKEMYVEAAKQYGRPILEALVEKALEGDVAAIKEFNDRALGKAPQTLDVTTEEKLKIDDEQLNQLIRARTERADNGQGSN